MKQQFFFGDLVHITKDLPQSMRHFECDQPAIVLYSYAEQFGGNDVENFSVFLIESQDEVSWYHPENLTLIEPDRVDLLPDDYPSKRAWQAKKQRDALRNMNKAAEDMGQEL
jgi:hypothetical protein